jgi:hypothetical protein
MKKYLLVFLALTPLMTIAQSLDILPDSVWEDSKSTWCANGVAFYNYQDTLFTGIMDWDEEQQPGGYTQALTPAFYTFNQAHYNTTPLTALLFSPSKKNNISNFGYPNESLSWKYKFLLGKNFFFEFNALLWHFHHILDHNQETSYECFAQLDRVHNTNRVYYDMQQATPDVKKYGAFQLDSLLFFIGLNQNTYSYFYHQWCIQQYAYDSVSGKFIEGPNYYLSDIPRTPRFGGFIKRIDSLKRVSFILDTYNPGTSQNYIGLLTYTKSLTGYVFNYEPLDITSYNSIEIGAVALTSGSLKGQKTSEANPDKTDRISYLMIPSTTSSDGKYHMYYKESYITPTNQLTVMNQGSVTLGNYPCPVPDRSVLNGSNILDIACGTELIPKDWSNLEGNDAFQSRIGFFYPDKKAHLNAAEFLSDKFLSDNTKTVSSNDLGDLKKYPYIKGLWTLIGIVDGAPPCSMDWHKWDSLAYAGYHPTELSLTFTTSQAWNTTVTYDDQWSVGASFEKLGKEDEKHLIGSLGLKYFGAYTSEFKQSNKVTYSLEKGFNLTETAQDTGVFLYSVPEITRYQFNVYPWWDKQSTYPIPNTLQYMFRTTGMALKNVNVSIHEFPFGINQPNDPSMQEWNNGSTRSQIKNQSAFYNVSPLTTMTWTSPSAGDDGTYSSEIDVSSKYTYTNGFSQEASIGVEIPSVFKLSLNQSYDFSYSTSTECETTTEFEIAPSLKNLEDAGMGPRISYLAMDVYYLKHDSSNSFGNWEQQQWYFYDSLNGMKPWYIAYIVNDVSSKIRLLSPRNQDVSRQSGFLFVWDTEGDELSEYTIFVYQSASCSPSGILYSKSVGDTRSLDPVGFTPKPGKTYFWRVRGFTSTGEIVWSPTGSFSIEGQKPGGSTDGSPLKAVIYPNPGNQGEVKVSFSAIEAGTASCSVYSTSGILLYSEKIMLSGSGQIMTLHIPSLSGPGIYFVEIVSNGQRVIRKMMIL